MPRSRTRQSNKRRRISSLFRKTLERTGRGVGGGTFPDSLCSYDLADIKGNPSDAQATRKTMPAPVNDASCTGVIKSLKFHNSSACVMETKTNEPTHFFSPRGVWGEYVEEWWWGGLPTNQSVTARDEG